MTIQIFEIGKKMVKHNTVIDFNLGLTLHDRGLLHMNFLNGQSLTTKLSPKTVLKVSLDEE